MKHSAQASTNADDLTPAYSLLILLVIVDLLFIGMHVVHVWSPWLKSLMYSLERDSGLAEQYQYIKHIWVAACFAILFLRQRAFTFAGWSLFFAYLFVDDALQVHESMGTVLSDAFGFEPMFGLRAKDFGEIAVAATVGVAACVFAWLTFRRGREASRNVSADVLCLLVALGLFGVFFDTLHTITYFRLPAVSPVFALIEDGGEMLVVSLTVAYAFDVLANAGRARIPVWSWVRPRLKRVRSA